MLAFGLGSFLLASLRVGPVIGGEEERGLAIMLAALACPLEGLAAVLAFLCHEIVGGQGARHLLVHLARPQRGNGDEISPPLGP
jgi:hypothetical protein